MMATIEAFQMTYNSSFESFSRKLECYLLVWSHNYFNRVVLDGCPRRLSKERIVSKESGGASGNILASPVILEKQPNLLVMMHKLSIPSSFRFLLLLSTLILNNFIDMRERGSPLVKLSKVNCSGFVLKISELK
eukprot:TRINITY_DN13264_c0_g1_i2.p1 TRINITY_DN13264_c0_g1~~TRINITY_DN13264_c0_g1_i2.p1  ORF type:complete len:134 (+),score=22.53 TRINITY_DN13264_c0_g1_i2:416-817(+)